MWTNCKYFFTLFSEGFSFCIEGPDFLVRFKDFTIVSKNIVNFWSMTSYSQVDRHHTLGGIFCQRLQCRRKYRMTISSTKTKSMAMWGNHIQRVKIVINENIIEQVTYFKQLGYCISEYKSGLEDKSQTYNKINGAVRRHFGKKWTRKQN